ncbi:MAG: tRNA guanosine(34) transglycosylase Tgt, partial [Longimicrobiales bacterium]|nr:tRNA guanosine(34) transglycosylase Tgt [Longimicrobiales bacterium]
HLHATDGAARAGTFHTPHGVVETPMFMPVGTLGTVKGLSPDEVRAVGASMILANTYHLYLRPGHEVVRALGGLHDFMRWDGPILTDSGGYQVFSLAEIRQIRDDGVVFKSHIDGSTHLFTPESVMEVQRALGADVVMAFDECPPGGATRAVAEAANERTTRWLARCQEAFAHPAAGGGSANRVPDERAAANTASDGAASPPRRAPDPQTLFPIVQGNVHDELRRAHARQVLSMGDWDGFGIGGLSVGEPKPDMYRTLELLHGELPVDRPRYLMGVGYPEDLLEAIARGVDLFDCVAATRNGRRGSAWTLALGQVNFKAARFRLDREPMDPGCDCYACLNFDRAYLRHLIVAEERLAERLVSVHNLRFLIRLAEEARRRILAGDFQAWAADWLERYRAAGVQTPASQRGGRA